MLAFDWGVQRYWKELLISGSRHRITFIFVENPGLCHLVKQAPVLQHPKLHPLWCT